jgi:T5orf172 domain
MSFGYHTPESLLPRSDSKNPATTCKGITQEGRPCRNGLKTSPGTSPAPSPSRGHGVLAVLQDGFGQHNNAAAFYCWRHQDQADELVAADTTKTKLYPLKEKSSIDTLVDRLGVLDLEEDVQSSHKRKRRRHDHPSIKKWDTMPAGWQGMQGPLMTVPEGFEGSRPRPKPAHGRSNLKASFLCCLRADDDDWPPPRRPQDNRRPHSGTYQPPQSMSYSNHSGRQTEKARTPIPQTPPRVLLGQAFPASPSPLFRQRPISSQSQTQAILSLIPKTLQPQTVAALMTEVSRPLTDNDLKLSGYIYIFWLTPETEGDGPDSDLASTILDDASPGRDNIQDEMLERYSSQSQKSGTSRDLNTRATKTVVLKIGRATNVHRRMTQWQKQCGHNITLLRYYPNASASTSVPLVPRVERLIQIELADLRVKQDKCESCGREHREWFDVDASQKGIRMVDECVRRWVRWGQEESRKLEAGGRGTVEPGGYY